SVCLISVRVQNVHLVLEQQLPDLRNCSPIQPPTARDNFNGESVAQRLITNFSMRKSRVPKNPYDAAALQLLQGPAQRDQHAFRAVVPLTADQEENRGASLRHD